MPHDSSIQPLGKRLLVRRYTRPHESPGGIIIPDAYREDDSGLLVEILAVGTGCKEGLEPGMIAHMSGRFQLIGSGRDGLYFANESDIAFTYEI